MLSPHKTLLTTIIFLFFCHKACADIDSVTVSDAHYTTSSNITATNDHGIDSNLSGSSGSFNSITNNHIITTGNSGTASSDYGIRLTGAYYQIFNEHTINTTGSSGRGISIDELTEVYNNGTITTQGSSAYGIYALGDTNIITNTGTITTNNTSNAYGIYVNTSDNNTVTNAGTINSQDYGMYFVGDNNTIINSGSITTTNNTSAHGIFISAASHSDASASNYSTVNNSGTITSSAHGINARDDFIRITNSGTITSADDDSDYAIILDGNDAGIITNSGTLNAHRYGIYNGGTNATINNLGTINGGVYIGDGVLNILGGTISKEVNGGAGLGSINIGSDSMTTTFNQLADFNDLDNLTIYDGSALHAYHAISANSITLHDNASLTLYDGFSLSGNITGVNSSSGTITLSGTSFAASTTIGSSTNKIASLHIENDAIFNAQHDLYVSNINIANGTLNLNSSNNLTLDGNVTGSGSATINLGTNNQNISGQLTLSDSDQLSLTLGDSHGNITSNSANISADTRLNLTTDFTSTFVENNSSYTIINSTSGAINAITDDNINVNGSNSNRIGLLTYRTLVDASTLSVTITRLGASQASTNQNSQQIYRNIFDDITADATDELFEFQRYLDHTTLSQEKITFSLNQLAPQSTKALLATNRNIITNAHQSIDDHLSHDSNGGLWMQSFTSIATQDAIDDDEGYDLSQSGFVIGSDISTGHDNIIGGALTYAKSRLESSTNLKDTQIDSVQLSLYDHWSYEQFFFNHMMAFTYNEYASNKTISAVNQKSRASFDGQAYSTRINAGFTHIITPKLSLRPEISSTFIKSNIDSYHEHDSGSLNLQVQKVSANFLDIAPALTLRYKASPFAFPEFNHITTTIKIAYASAIINDAPATKSNFVGHANQFNTAISNLDDHSLRLDGEIIGHHIDNMTFSTSYHFEKRASYQSHSLFLKIRQIF